MLRKGIALWLALALLLPAVALGEATALPFGLKLGMNAQEAEAAFAADATLAGIKPDKEDYGAGAVEYMFDDVAIPGTELIATSLSVQVDQNNSARADRLTSLSFTITPSDRSIESFRTLLATLTAAYGAPTSDPFDAQAKDTYVEWGTLDAAWTLPDVRVSLSMARMYEESVMIQYSSRLNYDPADLAQ